MISLKMYSRLLKHFCIGSCLSNDKIQSAQCCTLVNKPLQKYYVQKLVIKFQNKNNSLVNQSCSKMIFDVSVKYWFEMLKFRFIKQTEYRNEHVKNSATVRC